MDDAKPKPTEPGRGPSPARTPFGDEAHEPQRQRTIDALCEAFANDELEVEEFERRVATAHRATSAEELRSLLSGLPSANLPAPVSKKGQARKTPAAAPVPVAAPEDAKAPAPYMGEVREWSLSVGVMGGMSRVGSWVPARRNVAIGVMGGCEIDLREAPMPPGVTEIFCVAFWGGVEIIAPPWVHVDVSGVGIMGGFEHDQSTRSSPPPGAPTVRISGIALMGGVSVVVRYPGESAKDARRRIKEERKSKRLGRGADHKLDEDE